MTSEVRVSAQQVKELRDKTGAPMMDCKSALTEAGGDLAAAEVVLRKRGIATAQKKSGRTAQEGLVAAVVRPDTSVGALVEVNCESDFVARTEDFQELLQRTGELVASQNPSSVDGLMELAYPGGGSVKDAVGAKVGKLGVMVEVNCESDFVARTDDFRELVHDVSMQIAATDPRFIRKEDVTAEALEKEKEVARARALAEGKPEKIIDKIVEGRLTKYYEEVCLLEQPFVKDNTVTIGQLITSKIAKMGENIAVNRFVRFKVGESAS